jgi:hypothetical protein
MRNREQMTLGVASMVVGMIGLTVGVAGQEPDGNLIINGSFEDSPDVDGYHSLDEGSDAISAAFASAEPAHRRSEIETRTGAASFGSPLSSRPTQNVSRLGRILITSRRPLSTSTTTGRAKSTSGASTQRATSS